MPSFGSRTYESSKSYQENVAARYRSLLKRQPFLFFGLPFLTIVLAGSFWLTPATAIRYERHDKKTRILSEEEALGLLDPNKKRKVNRLTLAEEYARLAAKDIDNWEQKRVKRLPGEPDGILR